jgi:hypothetical protein
MAFANLKKNQRVLTNTNFEKTNHANRLFLLHDFDKLRDSHPDC